MDNIVFERIWEDEEFYEIKTYINSEFVSANGNVYTTSENIYRLAIGIKSFCQNDLQHFLGKTAPRATVILHTFH